MKLKFLYIVVFFTFSLNLFAYDVTVSILPQKYFVKKIASNLANVNVMVLPGNNPATYEPKPNQMLLVAKSKIYFSIGVPFEKIWLSKILSVNKNILHIKTYENIERKYMIERDKHLKNEQLDPHIWLSPKLVKIQAGNILNALIKVDGKNKGIYKKNYNEFIREIDELDNKIHNILKNLKNRKFMVFHPSWGYFAENYNLEQIPVEIEGKTPSMKELYDLINFAKKNNIKVIFVQPQFSKKSANIIAKQINGKVVVVNPLAENWSENLLKTAKIFKMVLYR